MSKISVNGKEQELTGSITLLELIRSNNVEQPDMISVQLNGTFVSRNDFDSTLLSAGDEVDFLYFMGGGSRC